ncbi:MAG: UDP-glucose/GDP-mannose dehydrogenase family protein, partial [Planctomycetales bacterium]
TVIMFPHSEFQELSPQDLARREGTAVVIDCWRILSREKFQDVCRIVRVGTDDVQSDAARFDDASNPKDSSSTLGDENIRKTA